MTKDEFKGWLQDVVSEMLGNDEIDGNGIACNCGDVWRAIEDQDRLEDVGVKCAWDHQTYEMIFRCEDGLLASTYEVGMEGETVWVIPEFVVEDALYDYTFRQLGSAIGRAEEALDALRGLV